MMNLFSTVSEAKEGGQPNEWDSGILSWMWQWKRTHL